MEELEQKIGELEARLDRLVRTQIDFQTEVTAIRNELKRLRSLSGSVPPVEDVKKAPVAAPEPAASQPTAPPYQPPPRPQARPIETTPPNFGYRYAGSGPESERSSSSSPGVFSRYSESARADLEKFIGENLISKIGILVLIIGLGIGVKYSIDNNLISPLARVIIAYLFAFGLVGLSIYLKPRYLNFSAALISGGMATMYFVTYFAYTAYSLIGQGAAFGLMAACTVFTVAAALFYNRQVIAHIGLVGAYAVPFLLSSDSGNYLFLFIYMAIINAGILAVSVQRRWRPLFYTASGFTWLIFLSWFAARYEPAEHFGLALVFLGVFFAIFFATRLVQVVMRSEPDDIEGNLAAAATALIFYVFCFAISESLPSDRQLWTLFSYLSAFTLAVIVLSFRFVGKILVYLAFASVWLIYGSWYLGRYEQQEHFLFAAVFAALFFAVFYATTLIYRLASEGFDLYENSAFILTNSFIFYGFGYSILNGTEQNARYLGAFTAAHSAFHLAVAHLIGRLWPRSVDVVQVLTILVLTFASIAIPVQFDGNQVTMIWSVEAALLFWFGRTRGVTIFEYFSYPMMVLGTLSLFLDWGTAFYSRTLFESEANLQPFANGNFITALVYIAAFSVIFSVSRDRRGESGLDSSLSRVFEYTVAGLAIIVLYNAFRLEIGNYFHLQAAQLYLADERGSPPGVRILAHLNSVWQIDYTMLFLSAMALVNLRKARSPVLANVNCASAIATLLLFATAGMVIFYELRLSYLAGEGGYGLVSIRYVSYAASALLILALHYYKRSDLISERISSESSHLAFEAIVYSFIFVLASSELTNLMAQLGIPDGTKLGLSIFWGIYALAMVVIGIAWNRKHLRIAAIALLAVTLAKLFFYDVADLDTIPRTILFVSLGLTLLVISFLYNKYKNVIFGVSEESEES